MIFRTIGTFAFALTILIAAYLPQAQALTVNPTLVEYDLTITFTPPPNSSVTGPPIFTDLTGGASFSVPFQFGETTINLVIGGLDIGTLIPGNPVFTGRFIPSDPVSPVSFSFGGTSGGFPAFAFPNNVSLGNISSQQGLPILPLPIFEQTGPPIRVSGLIVAFDDPEVVGTWEVTELAQTPLPAALPLFATGLGALGLLGWRRKRKASAALTA